jgi:hypothetical protein
VTARTVQYRVAVRKGEERVEGPDDADAVVTCVLADAAADPTLGYVRGAIKVAGSTGAWFDALRSGEAARALSRLASPA